MKVLVVEDSDLFRTYISEMLRDVPGFEVELVADGEESVRRVLGLHPPSVVLMDLHLPGISGLEAICQIMSTRPVPIVVLSSHLSARDQDLSFQAFEAGCVEVLAKPQGSRPQDQVAFRDTLARTLRLMAKVKVIRRIYRRPPPSLRPPEGAETSKAELLAIGASTGGPAVLSYLLKSVAPPLRVPVLVTQHIAAGFDRGFCRWLAETSGHPVKMVEAELPVQPGNVYVAPASGNLVLRSRRRLAVEPPAPPRITPNVDSLFTSVAEHFGSCACGILLTGMGRDGAEGLLRMRQAQAWTIAQDEDTCTVFGMPGAAVELGAAREVLSDRGIADFLQRFSQNAPTNGQGRRAP